jgi:hypothetical protein
MKKIIMVGVSIIFLSGCASLIAKPPQVVLLPEDRIFTVSKGTPISVKLDGKQMDMTFPHDMKLVSSTVLVRQEEKLNNEMLKSVKANADKNKAMGIAGSIFAILAAGVGIIFKTRKWLPNIKANVEVK